MPLWCEESRKVKEKSNKLDGSPPPLPWGTLPSFVVVTLPSCVCVRVCMRAHLCRVARWFLTCPPCTQRLRCESDQHRRRRRLFHAFARRNGKRFRDPGNTRGTSNRPVTVLPPPTRLVFGPPAAQCCCRCWAQTWLSYQHKSFCCAPPSPGGFKPGLTLRWPPPQITGRGNRRVSAEEAAGHRTLVRREPELQFFKSPSRNLTDCRSKVLWGRFFFLIVCVAVIPCRVIHSLAIRHPPPCWYFLLLPHRRRSSLTPALQHVIRWHGRQAAVDFNNVHAFR